VIAAQFRGMKVAVKALKLNSSTLTKITWKGSEAQTLSNEIRILRRVRHPNVILFHGACIHMNSKELALVLELVVGHRLQDHVGLPPELPNMQDRCSIICDISSALAYLHGSMPPIVHGDLSGTNILVETFARGPKAKLIDFGLARLLTRNTCALGGTINWMAPEILKDPEASAKTNADVFSFGRLLHFVMSGRVPFKNYSRDLVLKCVLAGPLQNDWTDFPFPDDCMILTNRCLEPEPACRPAMMECQGVAMSWLLPELDASHQPDPEPWSPALKKARASLHAGKGKYQADAIRGGLELCSTSNHSSLDLQFERTSPYSSLQSVDSCVSSATTRRIQL